MKYCALKLEFVSQFGSVDQISVMRKSKITLDVPDYKRLNVVNILTSGGRIPNMTYCHISLAQMLKPAVIKHIGYKPVTPIMTKNTVVIYRNTAAFLPSVLQSVKRKIRRLRNRCGFVFKNPKYAAFFFKIFKH